MSVLVAFSVSPVGTGQSMGAAVADAVRVVRESGLDHEVGSMFTTVEGDYDEVMAVVGAAVAAVRSRAPRTSLVLKADIREDATDALHAKVTSVHRHLE